MDFFEESDIIGALFCDGGSVNVYGEYNNPNEGVIVHKNPMGTIVIDNVMADDYDVYYCGYDGTQVAFIACNGSGEWPCDLVEDISEANTVVSHELRSEITRTSYSTYDDSVTICSDGVYVKSDGAFNVEVFVNENVDGLVDAIGIRFVD